MKRITGELGFWIGVLLIAPVIAVLFLAATVLGASFPPYTLFDFISRVLPGNIVTFGIDLLVGIVRGLNLGPTASTAKTAERVLAVIILAVGGIILSMVFFRALQQRMATPRSRADLRRESLSAGAVFGVFAAIPVLLTVLAYERSATLAAPLNLLWLLVVFLGWGVAHGLIFAHLTADTTEAQPVVPATPASTDYVPPMMRTQLSSASTASTVEVMNRRQFLVKLGGASAVITVAGTGLSAWLNASRAVSEIAETAAIPTARLFPAPVTEGMLVPAPGTRPEYTPLKAHYRIDINAGSGPVIAEEGYKLELSGLVDNPTALTVAQIRADFPAVERIITMSCISNPVAGDLIGTTKWTGISMQKLLDLVKPKPEATHIRISAADGFWEVVALDVIREDESVMLAYAWDDQLLTGEHGFPLRIHIPNRYGMKQPKWITKMEFIAEWEPGYWVERGWDQEALVRATSVIDTVAVNDAYEQAGQKLVPIGGIAWAGTKGISKVEVKVDEGAWQPAQLRTPLSDRTWVLWRFEWPFAEDWHTFSVRCYDGDGVAQIEQEADVRPSGATGLHYKQAKA